MTSDVTDEFFFCKGKGGSVFVESNNAKGIYGKLAKNVNLYDEEQAISIAQKHEVKEGEAWIRCRVDGEIKDYEIQIEHIEKLNLDGQKNFMIRKSYTTVNLHFTNSNLSSRI